MDDYVTLALLASTAFFVALSFSLLRRYRQVSQRISTSSELGRDLWETLEQRLKKQDGRIVDLMAKFDVIQARVMAPPQAPLVFPMVTSAPKLTPEQAAGLPPSQVERPEADSGDVSDVAASLPVASALESQPESQLKSQRSQAKLEETQVAAIGLLREAPMNTRQITDALRKSREHTARIMKSLFDLGLVRRDDSAKPFVYQLTDEGRRVLTSGA
jgi:CRP-like cAMP-binding protein